MHCKNFWICNNISIYLKRLNASSPFTSFGPIKSLQTIMSLVSSFFSKPFQPWRFLKLRLWFWLLQISLRKHIGCSWTLATSESLVPGTVFFMKRRLFCEDTSLFKASQHWAPNAWCVTSSMKANRIEWLPTFCAFSNTSFTKENERVESSLKNRGQWKALQVAESPLKNSLTKGGTVYSPAPR